MFTVTVADTNGLLSVTAGAAMVTGNGSKDVTISGSLSAVSTALGTLSDTDGTAGSDTITVNASDSFGNTATQKSIGVTVTPQAGTPSITAPATATVGVGQAALISGVSITELPTTSGETFTVGLSDTNGVLSANTGAAGGGGGTITPSNGGKTLTISGTLTQVKADLTTLADTDGTTPSDTILVNASDSNGGTATPASIAVTVNGLPAITAPTPATTGVGKAASIPGASLTESGNTTGETFTVTVADTNGLLSVTAGAAMVTGNGSKDVTISGSLSAVSTALGTLSDTDGTAGSDTITVNASDSFGNVATQTMTAITVNGLPAITAPTPATIRVGKAASIPGGSLTESGNTTGETFTVTVADTNGLLSVTAGAAMVTGNGSKDVTISGSLSAVSTALGTLSDTDGTAGSDTITVNASDSFGNVATQTMTAITVPRRRRTPSTSLAGGTISGGVLQNAKGGLIDDVGAGSIGTGTVPMTLNNQGTIIAGIGGLTLNTGNNPITNTGSLDVELGTLTVDSAVTGVGKDNIGFVGTMVFNASVSSGQTIDFYNPPSLSERLTLEKAQTFAGTVAGLATENSNVFDAIDLANFQFANHPSITSVTGSGAANTTTNVIVTDGSSSVTLHLLNQYMNWFAVEANAYSLTSDNPHSASAGTLFSVDLAPGHPNNGTGT